MGTLDSNAEACSLRKVLQEEVHLLMTQLRGEIAAELREMHRRELNNFSLQIKHMMQEAQDPQVSAVSATSQTSRRPKRSGPRPPKLSEQPGQPEASISGTSVAALTMPSSSLLSNPLSTAARGGSQQEAGASNVSSARCCPNKRMLKLVSHELKAPLNGLAGYTRTLAETDSKHQKEFKLLSNTAQFALEMVTNLTDLWTFANYEMGGLQSDPVNLEELNVMTEDRLGRAVNRKGKPLLATGVAMKMAVKDASDAVRGDFNALSLLEYHLVSNSAKFTEKGQVDVRWEKTELGENCLTVQDTGIGCSSELLKHIFDPFVVEDSSESRKREGIGLGLAVVHEIARLHNAQLSVESTKGVGSTFRVTFPATASTTCLKSHRRPRMVRGM